MYKIYIVNTPYVKDRILIYDDDVYDESLRLSDPKLHLEVNSAGTLEFSITPDNVGYDKLVPMKTQFIVMRSDSPEKNGTRQRNEIIWFGRALTIDTDIYKVKSIHCEGGLSYLNDVVYRDNSEGTFWNATQPVGVMLYSTWNDIQDNVHHKLRSYDVSGYVYAHTTEGSFELPKAPLRIPGVVFEANDQYKTKYWGLEPIISNDQETQNFYFDQASLSQKNYASTSGILNPDDMTALDLVTGLLDATGGYYWVSLVETDAPNGLDRIYGMQLHLARTLKEPNENYQSQTIRFGENLTDYTENEDGSSFWTAIHPYGTFEGKDRSSTLTKNQLGSKGTTPIKKLNWHVESVADNYPSIIIVDDLAKEYGVIVKDLDVGTLSMSEQLIGMSINAIDSLNIVERKSGSNSWTSALRDVTITGVDMTFMGADYNMIDLMDSVHIISEPHGVDTYLNVTSIDVDLQRPENSVYVLNGTLERNMAESNGYSGSSSGSSSGSGGGYTHPRYTEHALDLYKVANDSLGHVSSVDKVTKEDLFALGVPSRNTTYDLTKKDGKIILRSDLGNEYPVPDDDTKYTISKTGDTIKMEGTDGSVSEVEVIGGTDTKYNLSSFFVRPSNHSIELIGSDDSKSTAILNSFMRHTELRGVSTTDNPDTHTERGHLELLTSFEVDLDFDKYDWSHPFTLILGYRDPDDTSDVWKDVMTLTVSGTIHVGDLSRQIISDLSIKSSNEDYKFSVYAYGINEPAVSLEHQNMYYCVWLAVYCDTEVPYEDLRLGSDLTYTNPSSGTINSPAGEDHWVDYDKMVLQDTVVTSASEIKYSLSKYNNQITLSGSDGSSSSVTDSDTTYTLVKNGDKIVLTGSNDAISSVNDSDTKYELAQYVDLHDGSYPDGPTAVLKDSSGGSTEMVVPRVMTHTEWDAVYRTGYGNLSGTDNWASVVDIAYNIPDDFHGNGPIFIGVYIFLKYGAVFYSVFARINVVPSLSISADIFPTSVFSPPNVKWKVLHANYNNVYGVEDGTYATFQLCVDQESMKHIFDVNASARLTYATSSNGVLLKQAKSVSGVDEALAKGGYADVHTSVILSSKNASDVAFTGDYNDLSNKPTIPNISGKQDKSTAVTHSANTAVGSATKPVYVAANGAATPISHSINSDVPANAKFTDTTYSDATQSTHGLMTAADKKKLDGMDAMITNSAVWIAGANNAAKWYRLGVLVSSGNFSNAVIRVWSGDGANGRANQNSSFEIQIKDGWQSTESATKACGVTVYRINCSGVKVKVIPTAHDTYTVWAYLPWTYWNGNYAVYGKYKSWTSQQLIQSDEPEGTAADTAYYDQAFLTSTVAKATEATTLTDSGWVTCPLAATGNTTYPSSSSVIKVRKYGKLVRLEASVNYKTAFGTSHNVATIPEGYRPSMLQRAHGNMPIATEKIWFDALLLDTGSLSFIPAGSNSSTFNPASSYQCDMTYFID